MPNSRVFPLDGSDQGMEIHRLTTLTYPHDPRRRQSAAQHQPPQWSRVPTREAANQKQQQFRACRRRPAECELPPQPRAAKHEFQFAEQILEMRVHHVDASPVFTRRAGQPLKIISPNVTASTPTINQRQIFWRFSSSACCK